MSILIKFIYKDTDLEPVTALGDNVPVMGETILTSFHGYGEWIVTNVTRIYTYKDFTKFHVLEKVLVELTPKKEEK